MYKKKDYIVGGAVVGLIAFSTIYTIARVIKKKKVIKVEPEVEEDVFKAYSLNEDGSLNVDEIREDARELVDYNLSFDMDYIDERNRIIDEMEEEEYES